MFENLMQVEHPNIVKFHKYWLDMKESQARVCVFFFCSLNLCVHICFSFLNLRVHVLLTPAPAPRPPQVIFITEYMSSGSLKQFLKKTKKNHKTMNVKVSVGFCWCLILHILWRCRVQHPSNYSDPYSPTGL